MQTVRLLRGSLLLLVGALASAALASGPPESRFLLGIKDGRIETLRFGGDTQPTNYIADKRALGDIGLSYRKGADAWQTTSTRSLAPDTNVDVKSTFEPKGDRLIWHIAVKNLTDGPIEIGSLSAPLPMRTRFDKGPASSELKHSFVSGAGSFLFWMRHDSVGPYLLMTCLPGTSLEYWNRDQTSGYKVFLHAKAEEATIKRHEGSWRLPLTSQTIAAHGEADYGFVFEWAKDLNGVRDELAKDGKLDVQVAPGMTVPSDLSADVALRSNDRVDTLTAEYPGQTDVKFVKTSKGYRIYRVKFGKLGENLLTVRQANGAKTYLEFFACQPVETLIKKRAAFLTKQQQRDPSKWYEGLLSEWNMKSEVQLSPDNYDKITGWRIYEVTCDDPGLGKPAFLASKNAIYPNQDEVSALDEYIDHFVWGGLQETTSEQYPYAIYGIPDWKTLRASKDKDPNKGTAHVWRCYDYPHIILMYTSMYRIASQYPEIKTRLSAKEYLQRAFGTAQAMFTVPLKIDHWSAYDTGFYNEVTIPGLIDDLKHAGMDSEANTLQGFWDRKVKTFVQGRVDLFGSEYAFDSTGFESTEALANYALQNESRLGISDENAQKFLSKQMTANLFCRGTIEPAYYYLGSDYRGGAGDGYVLSYMAQMGGTSVLDYYLKHDRDPLYLRLGYQSILSSWALMNAGTSSSDFGYWYPGAANDGAAAGGFEPASYGQTWLGQPNGRGAWYYSCEIDLGYCGALRAARTVVADDPIFGRFCFGGVGDQHGDEYRFVPKDGVRQRISIRSGHISTDVVLRGAHFDGMALQSFNDRKRTVSLWIEPTDDPGATLEVSGNPKSVKVIGDPATGSPNGANEIGASRYRRQVLIQF